MKKQEVQKNAIKWLQNNIIKCMLSVAVVLQIVIVVELYMLLDKADYVIEIFQAGGSVQESMQASNSQEVLANGTDISIQESDSHKQQDDIEETEKTENEDVKKEDSGQSSSANDVDQKDTEETKETPWNLTLVNKWNKMDVDYVPELKILAEGHQIDARIADELLEMIGDAKEAGYAIYILSAYRDMEKQISLYEAEVQRWLNKGYSPKAAEREAGKVVAVPGTSEHQLGLAVDLVSSEHIKLDKDAEKTKGYQWLVKHCHEYGFILRYPNGATEVTGIIYEPWHFRYVGAEAATEIMKEGITLEEYLQEGEADYGSAEVL